MLNKKLSLMLVPAALAALSSNAFSWGSLGILGSSTHTKIAAKALGALDMGAYPDMDLYSGQIKDGSTSEAGHENIHNGGGKLKDWWDGADGRATLKGGVLPNYTKLDVRDAYLNLGRMCHLTQDQAVPAHAAHIPHSIVLHLPPDGVEKYAGKNPDFGPLPQVAGDKQPYEYYQILQDETKSHLAEWVSPVTGKPFWTTAPGGARYADATLGPAGVYGGGGDTFGQAAETDARLPGVMSAREIAARQLGMAAGYTVALLESASRRLPPLVAGLSVYPNVAAPGAKVQIAFTALENRTRHLKYSVTLTPRGGAPRTILAGELGLDRPRPAATVGGDGQQAAPQPEELLFNKRVNLNWDAKPEGRPLAEGVYTVQVQLTDDDGNTVPASVNSDDSRENDTVTVFSVVNGGAPETPAISFN